MELDDLLIKKVELSELTNDENYTKYREICEKENLEHLRGRFVAYQHGMIVYIDYNKESLDKITEKLNRIICNDPILIIEFGSDSQYYLKRLKTKVI